MSDLNALADRVEAAKAGDRELDALIWCALNGVKYSDHNKASAPYGSDNPKTQVEFTEPPKRTRHVTGNVRFPHAQPVTASLDAAMQLVPDGCERIDQQSFPATQQNWAIVVKGDAYRSNCCATTALALTAAALRARAHLQEQSDVR